MVCAVLFVVGCRTRNLHGFVNNSFDTSMKINNI